jgi:hypothetical protein
LPPDEQCVLAISGGVEAGGVEEFEAGEGDFAAAGGESIDERFGACEFDVIVFRSEGFDAGADNFGGAWSSGHEPQNAEAGVISGQTDDRVRIALLLMEFPGGRVEEVDMIGVVFVENVIVRGLHVGLSAEGTA